MNLRRIATPYLVLFLLLPIALLAGCARAAAQEQPATQVSVPDSPARIAMAPNVAPASHSSEQTLSSSTQEDASAAVADGERPLPARLVMPTLEMDIPVVEIGWSKKKDNNGSVYSAWDEADYAAGWHKNSATPGEGSNVVLSGHNNVSGAVFRELDQLKRGDIAELYVDGVRHEYVVDKILIVPETAATPAQRRANTLYIEATEDEQLTLVSCWPRDNNTHRIIVIAYPVGQ